MKPTEMADMMFKNSGNFAQRALENTNQQDKINDVAAAIRDLAAGMESVSTGLRATYMLLEQMKQQQERARMGRP